MGMVVLELGAYAAIVTLVVMMVVKLVNAAHVKWQNRNDLKIEHLKSTKWGWRVSYPENFVHGECVDIGTMTYIQARYGVYLGHGVRIGSHVSIYSESSIDNKRGGVAVCDLASVGAHSVIMPGVTIGEGATVAALSFVTEDVPAGEVWGGQPAKKLKGAKGISKVGFVKGDE